MVRFLGMRTDFLFTRGSSAVRSASLSRTFAVLQTANCKIWRFGADPQPFSHLTDWVPAPHSLCHSVVLEPVRKPILPAYRSLSPMPALTGKASTKAGGTSFRAEILMSTSDEILLQIAVDCGFADQSHFCKVLPSMVGKSFTERRRRLTMPGDDLMLRTWV